MDEPLYKNLSLEDLPGEEWRDVVGYEGLYKVSNLGRVKMLERNVLANKSIKKIKEHILSQHLSSKKYLTVHFWVKNHKKAEYVHKLVLTAFIRERLDGEECNHLNEVRTDNRLVNLEWISHKENINYGNRSKRHSEAMRNHPHLSKPVIQFGMDGNFIAEYPSLREAGRVLNVNYNQIKECCKGRINNAFGYIFKYK